MKKELDLNVGYRYVCATLLEAMSTNKEKSLVVLIFFVPYVIFQPPMTVLTRKLGPTLFLGSIIVCWGGIMVVRRSPVNSRSNRLGNGLYEELAAACCN